MKDSYQDIIEIYKTEFPEIDCRIRFVDLERGQVHSLFFNLNDESQLAANWEKITNSVAISYQRYLETDFEKWNLYLFFLLPHASSLNIDLKYNIENNTFSSRKVVEDKTTTDEELISKHIINSLSIQTPESNTQETFFDYNSTIWDTLKYKTIKKINVLHEEQMKTYDQLVVKLKSQI
tara:strand:+ start:20089 stop:20625 length:537 start_codon:yes stop_codon:yes gene_type:complete